MAHDFNDRILRAFVERTFDLVTLTDAESAPVFVSPSSSTILGYTPDEVVAVGLRQLVHPDERSQLADLYKRLLAEPERPVSFMYRMRHKQGGFRVLEAVAQNLLDAPGLNAVVVQARDVTATAENADALIMSEARFRALAERGGDGFSICDPSGSVLYRNDGARIVLGYSDTDVSARITMSRLHPEDVEVWNAAWERTVAEPGHVERVEYRMRHRDGRYRTLQAIFTNRNDDAAVGGIVINYRDVTDLATARRDAETRAARQKALAELGIFAVSASTVKDVDEKAVDRVLEMLHLDAIDVVERNDGSDELAVVAARATAGGARTYAPGLDSPVGYALLHGGAFFVDDLTAETRFRALPLIADGYTRCVAALIHGTPAPCGVLVGYRKRGKPFTDDDAHMLQAVANLVGAKRREAGARADLERAEQQLRVSQKMDAVGRLAAGVAHDFNNLLVGVLGYTSLLAERLKDDADGLADVEEIRQAGERAAALTKQILAFSRQQVLKREHVDMNALVQGLTNLLRRVMRDDVALDFIPGHQLGLIYGDARQLEQVLMNLAVNAGDAMPGGGRFTVETTNVVINGEYVRAHPDAKPGRYVLLTVSDTGSGMPSDVAEKVFEPFFTTKEVGRGTGLGLATVHGIVLQHGGMINVYSEVARGTVFKIYLPIVERRASVIERSAPAIAGKGHETVLLADDDDLVRRVTKAVLERAGYRVLAAEDGARALALWNDMKAEIDLVLLDVVMPELSGPAVLERIRAERPGVRFLLASGYSSWAVSQSDPEIAARAIQKPYDPDELMRRVRAALDE